MKIQVNIDTKEIQKQVGDAVKDYLRKLATDLNYTKSNRFFQLAGIDVDSKVKKEVNKQITIFGLDKKLEKYLNKKIEARLSKFFERKINKSMDEVLAEALSRIMAKKI